MCCKTTFFKKNLQIFFNWGVNFLTYSKNACYFSDFCTKSPLNLVWGYRVAKLSYP